MRTKHIKKGLTVVIIALFIGAGVYPAVASVPIKTTNILQDEEIESPVITDISDSEEDCNCQPVSSLHLVKLKSLLNRLVVYNNLLSLLCKHNPELAEISEELSNQVLTLNEIYKKLADEPFPIICDILESIFNPLCDISVYYGKLSEYYGDKSLVLYIFYMALSALFGVPTLIIFEIGIVIGCWEWPP